MLNAAFKYYNAECRIFYCYAEGRHAVCCYAEGRHAVCCYAEYCYA
jgi:hypothetical protein